MLDADMTLEIGSTFDKFKREVMFHNGYRLIQANSSMEYHNVRLVKLNGTWKCIGVTHEYWTYLGNKNKTNISNANNMSNMSKDIIHIVDVGDGGCKGDKFERDKRLLLKGINSNNARYYFYVAQTCKDTGDFKSAISFYKKRIELEGWEEEVWYSMYMIATCYNLMGDLNKMELWGNRAHDRRSSRSEPIYLLTKAFREKEQYYKAYHYYQIGNKITYPENDILFVETPIYEYLFDYENTILQFWINNGKEKLSGLTNIITYLNKHKYLYDNVFSNMKFYMESLFDHCQTTIISVDKCFEKEMEHYNASSPSLIRVSNNEYLMNVRYVNYTIDNRGGYHFPGDTIKTENKLVRFDHSDNNFNVISSAFMCDKSVPNKKENNNKIIGLEDVRIFSLETSSEELGASHPTTKISDHDNIYFTATTQEYSDKIRIMYGEYDTVNHKYTRTKILHPPSGDDSPCEKNWIPFYDTMCPKLLLFVYSWHPLQIGCLDANDKLNIIITHDTPAIFAGLRGSTTFVSMNSNNDDDVSTDELWCIVHGLASYDNPRKYYHQFVVLDKKTYKLLKYSVPFYFNNLGIEYCIGLEKTMDNEFIICFSQNDSSPQLVKINPKLLEKVFIKNNI
jgi:tetratricopeptide (TPR) repeat protein